MFVCNPLWCWSSFIRRCSRIYCQVSLQFLACRTQPHIALGGHTPAYLLNVREFSQRWLGTSAVNHYWRQPSDEVKTVMKVCHPIDPHFPVISAAKSWGPLVLEDKVKTGATDRKTE